MMLCESPVTCDAYRWVSLCNLSWYIVLWNCLSLEHKIVQTLQTSVLFSREWTRISICYIKDYWVPLLIQTLQLRDEECMGLVFFLFFIFILDLIWGLQLSLQGVTQAPFLHASIFGTHLFLYMEIAV